MAALGEKAVQGSPVPVLLTGDVTRALSALGAAFYDHPSRRTRTVGLVGSLGKTTAAWLARGMFEETGEVTGRIGARVRRLWRAARAFLGEGRGGFRHTRRARGVWCVRA